MTSNSVHQGFADLLSGIQDFSPEQKRNVAVAALNGLPPEQQRQTAQGFLPTQITTDRIWYITVSAFAIVLVGSFLTLAVSVFVAGAGATSSDIILTVFSSVVAFLAGLLAPSPIPPAPAPAPAPTPGNG